MKNYIEEIINKLSPLTANLGDNYLNRMNEGVNDALRHGSTLEDALEIAYQYTLKNHGDCQKKESKEERMYTLEEMKKAMEIAYSFGVSFGKCVDDSEEEYKNKQFDEFLKTL